LTTLEQWVQATPALEGQGLRQPDLTVWFDLAPEIAATRLADARTPDRFEAQPVAFFQAVAAGYAERAAAQPHRFARINADQTREQVWQDLIASFVQRGWLPKAP
jgi:dTMP kinase